MTVKSCKIDKKNLATVEFSFDAETVEAEKAKAFRKNAGKYNIPGFRKGKAPRSIIEKMYGTGVFLEDAVNELLSQNYDEILDAPKKEVVSRPEFDMVSFDDELVMKAEMYVKPEIKLGEYKGLEFSVVRTPVEEEEINLEIENVRKRNAREIEITDRPAQLGDIANINYEGFTDGVAFEGGKGDNHNLKLGSGQFIPGFEDQVAGHNVNDEFDVNVTFPEDYNAKELAGKPAVFKVKINKITFEELPELNDDFAVEVSEFNTFAEYKADVEKKINQRHDDAAKSELEKKIDEKLAELVEAEIPASMIDNEVENMVRDMSNQISMYGLDFKTYLQYCGKTLDEYKADGRPTAEIRVKSTLALEKIAELENAEVGDEAIEAEYTAIAGQYGVEVDYAKENLPKEDVIRTLKLRAATEAVKAAAKVTYLDKEPEAAEEAPAEKPKKKRTTTKKAAAPAEEKKED